VGVSVVAVLTHLDIAPAATPALVVPLCT